MTLSGQKPGITFAAKVEGTQLGVPPAVAIVVEVTAELNHSGQQEHT